MFCLVSEVYQENIAINVTAGKKRAEENKTLLTVFKGVARYLKRGGGGGGIISTFFQAYFFQQHKFQAD